MLVAQRCASCSSEYGVPSSEYPTLLQAWCPACGHPNAKSENIGHRKNMRVAKTIRSGDGRTRRTSAPVMSTMRNPAGINKPEPKHVLPLEKFRAKVQDKGRAFIIGWDQSIYNYDLSYLQEYEYPIVGINESFRKIRFDAFVMTDHDWIANNLKRIDQYQQEKKGLFLFWQSQSEGKRWMTKNKVHGQSMCGSKVIASMSFKLHNTNVQYFEPTPEIEHDFNLPLRLLGNSDLKAAVNMLYIFGAREIYILGVDDCRELKEIEKELREKDCYVYSCYWQEKAIPVAQYEQICQNEMSPCIDMLRKKIAKTGKVFLLGAGPSLDELPLQHLFGFPVMGCNATFQKYPHMDALMFGDAYFVQHYQVQLKWWQDTRNDPPILFWQNYGGGADLLRVVRYNKGQSSRPIYENYHGVPFFALKHSVITSLINCAYYLGALEVYLAGVELGAGHFFDKDSEIYKNLGKVYTHFPHAGAIADYIEKQREYLIERGCNLATCYEGGLLKGRLPFVPLTEAADNRYLSQLYREDER